MLRNKILLQLLAIMLITMGVFAASYIVILRSYERLESAELEQGQARVLNALNAEIDRLDEVNFEWGRGGLLYALVKEPSLIFFRDIVIDVVTGSFNLSETAFFDEAGSLIVGRAADPLRDGVDFPTDEQNAFITAIRSNAHLLLPADGQTHRRGLMEVNGGISIVSSRPILENPSLTTHAGTTVAGGHLTPELLAALTERVRQPLELFTLEEFAGYPDGANILKGLLESPSGSLQVPFSRQQMDSYTLLPDINGDPRFVLKTMAPRDFMMQATRTMLLTGAGMLILFLALIGYFLLFLDKSVLRRLQGLSRTAGELSEHHLDKRLLDRGNDEISAFSGAFNRVLDSLQRSQQTLTYQATHDALTGLLNRHRFEDELQKATEEASDQKREHHLLFIDLDRFKIINDSCGHMAGDSVLREIAQLMRTHLRSNDVLGRIGGDEFGVILRDCRGESAYNVADNLRKAIVSFRFQAEGRNYTFGASIGLLSLNVPEALSRAAALTISDSACRAAKNSGRNRIHVHQSSDAHLTLQLQQTIWVNRVTEALEKDLFVFYAQRICRLGEGRSGLEILLRMRDQQGAIISPGSFLPAAERYGLMNQIDKWVLENFFNWLRRHSARLDQFEFFAINLSGQSLSDPDFLGFLQSALARCPVPCQKLCFEITETSAIENLGNTSRLINALQQEGCRFSLDDFGAGMSSFSYLKHLPVDMLKIDGVFCRNMHLNEVDRAMVRSINEIGHVMGLQTIAEYVEDEQVLLMARELGIDFAQGYHMHRPEPLDHLLPEAEPEIMLAQ